MKFLIMAFLVLFAGGCTPQAESIASPPDRQSLVKKWIGVNQGIPILIILNQEDGSLVTIGRDGNPAIYTITEWKLVDRTISFVLKPNSLNAVELMIRAEDASSLGITLFASGEFFVGGEHRFRLAEADYTTKNFTAVLDAGKTAVK